ncbi:TetR/AcrR family transcriptional regulator [Burkholderia sp. WAC0059]|uniref:TetR/AcrR family transcriptional regulator n=1 Tax=Burkholderia sp. WAC0059 TaxID=2066022 RepID=UPI000C7ED6E4|nr:TetR/AcrR family transcriptional regulator [Burkholderia sp. WAC0059]PLZ00769.1 TetR/AcrR family transcriptional regulator [Burkholderia sp. WAC0059]
MSVDEQKAKAASPDRAESRDQYHHGDLKNALVAAAEALLEEKGTPEFSLRECARRVGVSPTAVAHHFGNVSGLIAAVATVSFTEFSKLLKAARKRAELNGSDPLEAICDAYLRFAERKPARYRIMFSDDMRDRLDPDYSAAARGAFEILREILADGTGHGAKDESERDSWATALFVWSALHGFATLERTPRLEFLKMPLGSESNAGLRRAFLAALSQRVRAGGI